MQDIPPDERSFALRANIFVLRLSRNWLRVALIFLSIYVALPILAPVLMRVNVEGPARAIYTLYTPFCHQLPFRSFFLFGEQVAYPRANVPGTGLESFDAYAADLDAFEDVDLSGFDLDLLNATRDFVGNEEMGYKMALCERDIFIYLALLTGGLLYAQPQVRRRLRPVPLWLYALLGLGPIGIDGFSQLLSYPPFELWPVRETAPVFRVVTGALFGFMSAWLGFPYLDESFQEMRRQLEIKLRQRGIRV